MAYPDDNGTGHGGLGLVLQSIVSDVEGHFGAGFVLATNVLIDVRDQFNLDVRRNTLYTLTITETDSTVTVKTILHDPSTPYQDAFPDNSTVVLNMSGSAVYLNFTSTFTILPNRLTVQRPRFRFQVAYGRIKRLRYF